MYRREVLSVNSVAGRLYAEQMRLAFRALPEKTFAHGTHVALKDSSGKLIGGATLEKFASFADDVELTKFWRVDRSQLATRISRLWCSRQVATPALLQEILESVDEDEFLYGVLALPLRFTLERAELFVEHRQLLKPILSLRALEWPESHAATSEGQRLLRLYRQAGAEFLGAPALDAENRSVRASLGLVAKEARLMDVVEKHAAPV